MDKATIQLTVYFEGPFWVGVFERMIQNRLSVCKVTFGAEPKDYDIQDFILKSMNHLKFSHNLEFQQKVRATNPKRIQRIAIKQTEEKGIGTKSQQALNLQHEEIRTERKHFGREEKDAKIQRLFDLKQQKRKEKHRGH